MEAVVNYSPQPCFKGSVVKEYLLVANPVAEVEQQVADEKKNFLNRYGKPKGIATKPHIIIARFLAKEEMEETLFRWMYKVIGSHKSFTVSLNNYSGFPDAHSIYLRVQDHLPFKQLAKDLKVIDELVRANGLPKARLIANPHLVIAGGIDAGVYEKAMMEYAHKEFYAAFELNELVLLKRTHQFDACRQVTVFRLLP